MVHVIALILFAGAELKIEMNSGMYVASLEEGWLSFSFRSLEVRLILILFVIGWYNFRSPDD